MEKRKKLDYVHEGQCVAVVGVALIDDETVWSPYLQVEDACRLDDVREALRKGDLMAAARFGRVYEIHPVAHK